MGAPPGFLDAITSRGRGQVKVGLAAAVLALLFYAGAGAAVVNAPSAGSEALAPAQRSEVLAFAREVRLPTKRPTPPPPPKVVLEVEVAPRERPPALPTLNKLETRAAERAAPKTARAAPRRGPKPKRRSGRRRRKSKAGPKTVVLSTAMEGGGGPRVYAGEEDVFGNPEVGASAASTAPVPDGPRGDGSAEARGDGGGGGARVEERNTRFVAPKVLKKVRGRYPEGAPRTGRQVVLVLSLRIDEAGKVAKASVVTRPAVAGRAFDKEALRVVRATRFRAATRGGRPVAHTIRYKVVFTP